MTLYVLPQPRIKNRFQEDWFEDLIKELGKRFKDVVPIYPWTYSIKADEGLFTNFEENMIWELQQLLELVEHSPKKGDIVFFADLDFPGFSTVFVQLAKYRWDGVKFYGFLHAGSYCKGDIFDGDKAKRLMEKAMVKLLDGIFVATHYHKKLVESRVGRGKIHVVSFPVKVNSEMKKYVKDWMKRDYDVAFVGRNTQKGVDMLVRLAKKMGDVQFVSTNHNINLPNVKIVEVDVKEDFYSLLGNTKIILSLAREETFGVAVAEGVEMGCVPLVPNRCSYIELYPAEFRYNGMRELSDKIRRILRMGKPPTFTPVWREYNFYERLAEVMKGEDT